MAKIHIPFNKWSRDRLKTGRKTATTRTKRYGNVGDTFEVDGKTYVITDVRRTKLGTVAYGHFSEEGCSRPSEFIEVWRKIHPIKGFDPHEDVWIHFFKEVNEE